MAGRAMLLDREQGATPASCMTQGMLFAALQITVNSANCPISRETWYRRVRTLSRSRQGSFKQMCDQCEERGDLRDYCNVCDSTFCQDCWKKQISHKKKTLGPGSVPHERTDEQAAKKIKDALDAKPNDSEQEALHKSDEDTTWFGITWDPSEDAEYPFFRDYGRYATIMDGALARSSEYNAQWHVHVGPHDRRYPSLVSFVGQTGKVASRCLPENFR